MTDIDSTLKIVVSIIGSISAILAFFLFKPIKIYKQQKKIKNDIKNEQFKGMITAIFKESVTEIREDIKKVEKYLKEHENAILCLTRTSLIKTMDDWLEKGYSPIHVKQIVENQYRQYKDMHGNGVVSSMYERFIQLPEHPKKKGAKK